MRTILTIILIYLVVRTFLRIVAPIVLQVFFNRVSGQFQQQASNSSQAYQSHKVEGEVSIDRNVDTTPKRNDDGDYVDYVEVK